ncbi:MULTISPECIES: glycosyltransferase family 39 protein [unclassified Saccharibacter]|uniref:ArnT family glycosyltransferase n=1 Tax=unclassified Saccharibacter TaxID=2648722 RepID=UPI00132ACD63|nr:phospholipid carrier-dependent glycosyltransferase [Saccharibacter sp. EH611]MXV57536.1 phospholipid carrier-dependent glycosyltransferase [Saccharibacter sp. EH70]MXV65157.1 phospholipid carrier-dependent glycosyltransferase [Saccharibacter sp. EH60]
MTLQRKHYLLLALLAFVLALPGRMALPPLDRDEPRYMEATEQMLSSGNYLDIRFQDHPRYLQPAGIYWLEAGSEKISEFVLGPEIRHQTWPYRLPSLLAASAIVPLTAWLGASLFSSGVGLLAAFLLMASTLFAAETRMATIDTVLLLDILCAEALLWCHIRDRHSVRPTPRYVTLGFWLALGCGLMLKGPIVLIPGLGTVLAFSIAERSTALWRRLHPLWGVPAMLTVALPWCIGIALVSHGAFFTNAVGHNLLGKIGHAQESHGFPPGYYLLVFLLSFWPGALFAVRALPSIWHHRRCHSVRFLLCWIIPHWVFFELLATKLPHYVLPTFPAIALLTAASLIAWPQHHFSRWGKTLLNLYGGLWSALGLLFCCAGTILLARMEHLLSIRALIALLSSLPLMLSAIWYFYRQKPQESAYCAIGTALLIHVGLFLAVIPALSQIQLSPRIAQAFNQWRPCPSSVLISASYHEPSLVFLAGEQTRLLSPSLAAQSLKAHARCDLLLTDRKDAPTLTENLRHMGIGTQQLTEISGLNYSNGHHLHLQLIQATPSSIMPYGTPTAPQHDNR